jgi:hypothetical protein
LLANMALTDRNVPLRTPEQFLPSTFEDRGAAIPFTTPMFAYARVRKDYRNRLELMVTRFTAAAGVYVVPWPMVPDIAALTTHDVMLYEEVSAKRVLNPYDMRLAALGVAKTGLAGPKAAEAATAALIENEKFKALNQLMLILRAIEETGISTAESLTREIATPEGQARVREAFFSIAHTIDLKREALDSRITELGLASYSVGTAWNPTDGRLRQSLKTLQMLHDSLGGWAVAQLGDVGDQARFCAEIAEHTLRISTKVLTEFDAALTSPLTIIKGWDERKAEVEKASGRLAWLLDGWDPVAEIWFGCRSMDVGPRADVLQEILQMLPLLPREELDGWKKSFLMSEVEGLRRKWVRCGEDWRTGEVDIDIVERLEALKEKTR